LLCCAAALVGLVTVGPVLVGSLGLLGIVLSEVILVGLPTLAFAQLRQVPMPLHSRGVIGGVLAGAGGFWLVALLEVALDRILPVPEAVKDSMRRLVVPGSGPRLLLWDVLGLAIAPAVCEEALFRGLVLPSLRTRFSVISSVVLTALLFGAFHLSIYRFVPTALLGVVLGLLRVWSGSLLSPIAFHVANNTLVIVMVRLGRDEPPLPTTVVGLAGFLVAVASLTVGVTVVCRKRLPT
jgi:sodium transport system permease protein